MQLCAWILSCWVLSWNGASADSNGQQWIMNKGDKSEANNGVSFKEGSDNSTNNNLDAIKIACYVQTEQGGGIFFLPVRSPFKVPWWGHSGEFNTSSCIWTTLSFRLKTRKGHTALTCGTEFWLLSGGKNVLLYRIVLSSAQLPAELEAYPTLTTDLTPVTTATSIRDAAFDGSVISESHSN